MPPAEANLHKNPDVPLSGPGDIFEWAAYFIEEEYEKMKKDNNNSLRKRVMENTYKKHRLMAQSEQIQENPMASYKFPGRLTFDEIKKPPNTGTKAPKDKYST